MQFEANTQNTSLNEKTVFFSHLALRYKKYMALHKEFGLLLRNQNKEKDWGNVTEHCLVEAARAEKISELLKFSEEITVNLIAAAIIHDTGKKIEIDYLNEHGSSLETIAKAQAEFG